MIHVIKFCILLIIPLLFMFSGCGLMNSYNALEPPIHDETTGNTYIFHIPFDAYDPDNPNNAGISFIGIEVYYRIFVGLPPTDIGSLTFSSQLASFGFKRLYKEGETTDDVTDNNIAKPLLNIKDYKNTPDYIKFVGTFDSNTGTITVAFYDSNDTLLLDFEPFELRRAASFPEDPAYPLDKQKYFKGFDEFEDGDIDINSDPTIWPDYINASPPVDVYLALYAYSYGTSLAPENIGKQIESRLTYLSYLSVRCYPYVED